MDTSGKAFIQHWAWASEKGVMNRNTANGTRTACLKVISTIDNWEEVDVAKIDVEDTLARFQNLRKKDFKPAVLETYKRRFRAGLESFLAYLEDPSAWKPRTRGRSVRPVQDKRISRIDAIVAAVGREAALVDYPFPIRDGLIARLLLPRDLKAAEVRRLTAFMNTLVEDPAPVA